MPQKLTFYIFFAQIIQAKLPSLLAFRVSGQPLSMGDEDVDTAILDFVAENITEFSLPPPASVLKKAKKKQKVAKHAVGKTAVQMLQALLAHRMPALHCLLQRDDGSEDANTSIDVVVTHSGEAAASPKHIASLRKQYGAAATALFEILAVHDGAALFVSHNDAAFYLVPSGLWGQHMEDVMSWAQQVTWQDDLDEIPAYLKSAIPFGYTPGDSERWLLITEGAHAGKVMLSDTDVIDDTPRYESLAEFMATFIVDAERIVGCGGHVCYNALGGVAGLGQSRYYPVKYKFEL